MEEMAEEAEEEEEVAEGRTPMPGYILAPVAPPAPSTWGFCGRKT